MGVAVRCCTFGAFRRSSLCPLMRPAFFLPQVCASPLVYITTALSNSSLAPPLPLPRLLPLLPSSAPQREFALKYMPDYPLFKLVADLYEVVPEVLGKTGKVGRGGVQRGYRDV